MATETGLNCNYCGGATEFVSGDIPYPKAGDAHHRKFYFCGACSAWVGVHDGTTIPLGPLADAVLRSAQRRALAEFDPLWKVKALKGMPESGARLVAYEWLAVRLGIPLSACHVARFDAETCQQVIELCEPYRKGIEEREREIAQRKKEREAA